jgi:hypothetical protein
MQFMIVENSLYNHSFCITNTTSVSHVLTVLLLDLSKLQWSIDFQILAVIHDRLCGLVARVSGYRS